MNVPSYNTLIQRDKLIKTVMELCEKINLLEEKVATLEETVSDNESDSIEDTE